eukprot:3465824-Prymnesium_polylepis.1
MQSPGEFCDWTEPSEKRMIDVMLQCAAEGHPVGVATEYMSCVSTICGSSVLPRTLRTRRASAKRLKPFWGRAQDQCGPRHSS